MKKLAIVTTHPIQYNAPWFKLLEEQEGVSIKVFYTWSQAALEVDDKVFGKKISWDIPLLEGYPYEFIENSSKKPGLHHFFGINCPDLIVSIKKYEPDAVLVFGWNFKSHLEVMRYFKGKIPVWFRGDSTLLDEVAGFKTSIRRLVLKEVYSYIDRAFYVGEANKAYFLKHGLMESQLGYAPHAIDNDRFGGEGKNYDCEALSWRKELGYTDDDIVVLFAGKFESVKQPILLAEAIQNLNLRIKHPIKLLFLGSGPLEIELKNSTNSDPNIQFLPFQNQSKMPMVYRLCDVFCLPSKSETWGLAINEAMACGKPVIVSNKLGCAQDIIRQNENGWVFQFDDKIELQRILENFSKDKLSKFGDNAKKSISKWNFNTIVIQIFNTFQKI